MKKFEIVISEEDEKFLLNDLADIGLWLSLACIGKISNCMKRAAKQYEEIAKKEGIATMPVQDRDKALALFARPDYKNRVAREATKPF